MIALSTSIDAIFSTWRQHTDEIRVCSEQGKRYYQGCFDGVPVTLFGDECDDRNNGKQYPFSFCVTSNANLECKEVHIALGNAPFATHLIRQWQLDENAIGHAIEPHIVECEEIGDSKMKVSVPTPGDVNLEMSLVALTRYILTHFGGHRDE